MLNWPRWVFDWSLVNTLGMRTKREECRITSPQDTADEIAGVLVGAITAFLGVLSKREKVHGGRGQSLVRSGGLRSAATIRRPGLNVTPSRD